MRSVLVVTLSTMLLVSLLIIDSLQLLGIVRPFLLLAAVIDYTL